MHIQALANRLPNRARVVSLAYRAQNPAPVMAVPEAGFGNGTERSGAMHKHQQFSKFEKYVKSRERKIKRSLSEIEKRGAAAALDKCLCSQSRSMAISAIRSTGTCSITFHCWQNFRSQLSGPLPCSMRSRLSIMTSEGIVETGDTSLATLPDAARFSGHDAAHLNQLLFVPEMGRMAA